MFGSDNTNIPEFDEKDWEAMTKYLQEWDNWRHRGHMDLPDFTRPEIYSIPPILALLKNAKNAEKLNKTLLCLTIILIVLTAVLAIPIIKEMIYH
jgi:hypothetical protein